MFVFEEHEDGGLSGRCERAEAKLLASQSELAALREDLARKDKVIQAFHDGYGYQEIRQRLTVAEQRNSELVDLLKQLRNVAHTKGGISLAAYIDPHLKPTESGASE